MHKKGKPKINQRYFRHKNNNKLQRTGKMLYGNLRTLIRYSKEWQLISYRQLPQIRLFYEWWYYFYIKKNLLLHRGLFANNWLTFSNKRIKNISWSFLLLMEYSCWLTNKNRSIIWSKWVIKKNLAIEECI